MCCGINKKYVLIFIFSMLASLFAAFSLVFPIATASLYSVFANRMCVFGGLLCVKLDDFGCASATSKMKAVMAFGILSALAFGLIMVFTVFRWYDLCGIRQRTTQTKMITRGLLAIGNLCALIEWPLAISITTVAQCDSSKSFADSGMSIGAGPFMAIVGQLFGLIALAIEFKMASLGEDDYSDDEKDEQELAAGLNTRQL